ncbi:MAG: WD40/YVTN/BNR-like repeat-containing protein [Candidatus Krumholzibacteriia bacterium]
MDSLRLLSPDRNGLRVHLAGPTQRKGAVIQWAKLPAGLATCSVPVIPPDSTVTFGISLSGAYLDNVDRELEFTVNAGGAIGSATTNQVLLSWANQFVSRTGRIDGLMNLSNSGGLWRYVPGQGLTQANGGFPMTLPATAINAFAQAPGAPQIMLAHLGGQGLWRREGEGDWARLNPAQLPDNLALSAIAFSPDDPDRFVVGSTGSNGRGLFVTADGGQTFTQFSTTLDPAILANYQVTALTWAPNGRIFASVRNLGVFTSADNGQSFVKLPNLTVPSEFGTPSSPLIPGLVNAIVCDPDVPSTIYFALRDYRLYRSTDDGATWAAFNGDWGLSPVPAITGLCVARDPHDPQVLVLGTQSRGIWRSADGGANWVEVATGLLSGTSPPQVKGLFFDASVPGRLLAIGDGLGVLVSDDHGASWSMLAAQPGDRQLTGITGDTSGDGSFWLGTYDGGSYVPGTPLPLSSTFVGTTDPIYLNLDLGLSLAFMPGVGVADTAVTGARFSVKCQDFQGYAVWRSDGHDPLLARNMELIGVYDKSNPQTCIEGFCGDVNYNITPDCFHERRAACFNFSRGDTIEFFDDNIYNGFEYNYAVTSFDYGSTANIDPASLTNDLLYSPRFPDDPNSIFGGEGNLTAFRVDLAAAPALDGAEIFVYPNPLRRGAGFKGSEGDQVVFTNLPPDSRIKVWTEDGDLVAELPRAAQPQSGGNIYWDTRNEAGASIASGIYFWKVVMPGRGDFYGKLVVIR